jgi:hypothetical protein
MVQGRRSTTVEVDGSPEHPLLIAQMLVCARDWLRSTGACRAYFPTAVGWPKCRACPLYDREWAAESGEPSFLVLPALGDDDEELEPQIPDHLPEDWQEG